MAAIVSHLQPADNRRLDETLLFHKQSTAGYMHTFIGRRFTAHPGQCYPRVPSRPDISPTISSIFFFQVVSFIGNFLFIFCRVRDPAAAAVSLPLTKATGAHSIDFRPTFPPFYFLFLTSSRPTWQPKVPIQQTCDGQFDSSYESGATGV